MNTPFPIRSVRALSDALHRSHAAVAEWLKRPDFPAGVPRHSPWSAADVTRIRAWADEGARVPGAPSAPDPLMDGSSPALERYRAARADMAEMERDRLSKSLVRVTDIEPALMQLTALLREAGQRIARTAGNDVAGILNEAVDEWERGLHNVFPDRGANP